METLPLQRKDPTVSRELHVINGPNLDMLGEREPEIYGRATLSDIEAACARVSDEVGFDLVFRQSNAEHEIIGWLHDAYRAGATVIINPAGLSFQSVPILDALRILTRPVIELHLSNIHARDDAHRHSIMSTAATAVIVGMGAFGYELAIRSAGHLSG